MTLVLPVLGMLLGAALLSTLLLLVPFGLMVGAMALFDPRLTLLVRTPGWLLLAPWYLLTALLAAGMLRPWLLLRRDPRGHQGGRIWRVRTDRYADDPSGAETVNGTPGRQFVSDYTAAVQAIRPDLTCGDPIAEDYGWGAWIGGSGSPVWIGFASAGREEDGRIDETVISVAVEPPPMPWQRLRWRPDFALRDALEEILEAFLRREGLPFERETEGRPGATA